MWAAARRLLAAGLDRNDVFRQLALAFSAAAVHDLDRQAASDRYAQALAALPLPTAPR